jgi:hypothetical protein
MGRAPLSASLEKLLPNPGWYLSAINGDVPHFPEVKVIGKGPGAFCRRWAGVFCCSRQPLRHERSRTQVLSTVRTQEAGSGLQRRDYPSTRYWRSGLRTAT